MLSKKAKYGLKAMSILDKEYGHGPLLIGEISQRVRIPSKFLELILLELKKKGFLQSKKGKGGGYYLNRLPETISVGALIRALDGPIALLPCVSQMAYERCAECPDEETCGIRMVFKEVRDSTVSILERTTLAQMTMVGAHPL